MPQIKNKKASVYIFGASDWPIRQRESEFVQCSQPIKDLEDRDGSYAGQSAR